MPIYHNQAIWPFVTAYWTKAARSANAAEAVDAGFRSLTQLAAFNLSNMENFDVRTGLAEIKSSGRNGPVINSRRQLWSVAAYLSLVQDIVFGLETSGDGLRFRPFITANIRNETFAGSDVVALNNFFYHSTRIRVRLHLPPAKSLAGGVCTIERTELNGNIIGDGFVAENTLKPENDWDIYLAAPKSAGHPMPLRLVDMDDERMLCGPLPPVWDEGQGGITAENGKLILHYHHADSANTVFNIYRDGALLAKSVRETNWTDSGFGAYLKRVHSYSVAAVDSVSGNTSHLTPPRSFLSGAEHLVIPAAELLNQGGNLAGGYHFENWGKPEDRLASKSFMVKHSSRFQIRAEFSNGMGPVNTGITCGVKKLELRRAGDATVMASGYLIMPQSGDWHRWDMSSPVLANLTAGESYVISISEDELSRNMSCLKNNERYTDWPGGGQTSCNYVNIAALDLQQVASTPSISSAK